MTPEHVVDALADKHVRPGWQAVANDCLKVVAALIEAIPSPSPHP